MKAATRSHSELVDQTSPATAAEATTPSLVTGIHHVTAIASDPQANVDFYAGLLGLRLVKKTVNFDDPSAYHLYYGDAAGSPGSIVTFFYWPGFGGSGRAGAGQMNRLSFSMPAPAVGYWDERLRRSGVAVQPFERSGESGLSVSDPDGIAIDLVAVEHDPRTGWAGGDIPAAHALRGLHTAELTVRNAGPTEDLLTRTMGFTLVSRSGPRARFAAAGGGSGRYVDVIEDATGHSGSGGVGTIHHLAWRVADDAAQLEMRRRLLDAGQHVSDVRDRSYFRSIYYREHGGILFEIATDVPGFAIDEPLAELGKGLKLPKQFERARAEIERVLPPLRSARRSP